MSIAPGKHLGPFEILAPIGAGGMGEVYKAKDTRLDRTVAIKVLPEHLAESAERKQRFQREAKAISQLNHPHICTLHDVGREQGIDFLVMEYIEGETLAERLKKGALPLEEALTYGAQIADGLDKAHRAGIVHRDLKPGNVIVTKSGVKLLDFGLAKLADPSVIADRSSDAPTRQKGLTDEHTLVGTLQYMAPEQLEGKSVDARTDIFALGALLYEMITGAKAFTGESQASLIGAILKDNPPPLDRSRPMTPESLDHIVKRCLAKEPDARWQAASDVMQELGWVREREAESLPAPTASAPSTRLALLLVGALSGGLLSWLIASRHPPETMEVTKAAIPLPSNQIYGYSRAAANVALSPDGRRLAYVDAHSTGGFYGSLYVRELDALEPKLVRGIEGAAGPFFSPDGNRLGFVAADLSLSTIALSGGAPATIHPSPGGAQAGRQTATSFSRSEPGPDCGGFHRLEESLKH